jgi:CHASE3 domain sensor protein
MSYAARMAGSFRDGLSAVVRPAMRLWNRIPMRTQGRITVGLPLLAVLISACLAAMGNYQRINIETDIQRKFEMSSALGELTTLMVNAETGTRGYQLTGQKDFLEPFDEASTSMPAALDHLTALAAAEPGEKPRADKLQRIQHLRVLTSEQLADLGRQQGDVGPGERSVADPELRQHLTYGKSLMDEIRAEVSTMQDEERNLLDDRIADITAIRDRDYASVILALAVALGIRFLAWYLFRTGTLRRVEELTDNVRNIRNGDPTPPPPPEKLDKLGELEQEIHLLGTHAAVPGERERSPISPTRSRS